MAPWWQRLRGGRQVDERPGPLPLPVRRGGALPAGRGQIDCVVWGEETLAVRGWLFPLDGNVDRYRLEVDGLPRAEEPALDRPDVGAVFAAWPQASTAGFALSCPTPATPGRRWTVLAVVALRAGEVVGRIQLGCHRDYRARLPDPPTPLRVRVVRNPSLEAYWLGGLQTYGELSAAIARHRPVRSVRRLLDWGCGCGRLASFFQDNWRHTAVDGCDLDGEAVAWCAENLPRARFQPTPALPPLPYADGGFDVVVAYSVFTHLDRRAQALWLAELRRVLAPGGLLLLSLHGDFALRFEPDERVASAIMAAGISDALHDDALDGIAPDGFYRCVFQTRDYSLREMTPGFEALEYRSGLLTNFQDLLVLRRPATGWQRRIWPPRRTAIQF